MNENGRKEYIKEKPILLKNKAQERNKKSDFKLKILIA